MTQPLITSLAPRLFGDGDDVLLTPQQLSKYLGVTTKCLERWRMSGEGATFIRLSRKVIRYRMDDVVAFINRRAVASTATKI